MLENNPMSWGSTNPRWMVLGFSKGTRQCQELLTRPHNEVPYAGFRHNVTAILRVLGLLQQNENVDDRICETERDFAFGSLIRCSIAHTDPLTDRASKSGDIIMRLARRSTGDDWAMACAQQFLAELPPRLEIVILLSNDDDYVEACFRRLRSLHPELKRINAVAYSDGRVTWIHTVHGSPLAQSHINKWLAGTDGVQSKKQRDAVAAARGALGVVEPLPRLDPAARLSEVAFTPLSSAPAMSKATKGEGKPLAMNPTRDAVQSAFMQHPKLRRHPSEKKEAKYIAAFETSNGRTLALDKMSAGQQPIWIEAHLLASDALPEIRREYYSPGRGRNSNLHKLPGFKDGALIRLYPESVSEAMAIVTLLLEE